MENYRRPNYEMHWSKGTDSGSKNFQNLSSDSFKMELFTLKFPENKNCQKISSGSLKIKLIGIKFLHIKYCQNLSSESLKIKLIENLFA